MAALAVGTTPEADLDDLTKKMAKVDLSGMSKEQRKRFEDARDDPELSVAALVAKHRSAIDTVKDACAKELSSAPVGGIAYDDLFIVRYLKSRKGDVEETIASVKACIAWRTENKEWIERAKAGEKAPKHDEISKVSRVVLLLSLSLSLSPLTFSPTLPTGTALDWRPVQEHNPRGTAIHCSRWNFQPHGAYEEVHSRRGGVLAELE